MAIELNEVTGQKEFALDHHMQKVFVGYDELGHPHFDSKSVIGEWVYQLKYVSSQKCFFNSRLYLQNLIVWESINLIVTLLHNRH